MSAIGAIIVPAVFLTAAQQEGWAQRPTRDEVQAAYLYNFGKFVRWPQGVDHGPIVLCVAEADSFGLTVSRLVTGEEIGGRPVQERNLDTPDGVGACSILFVGATGRDREESFLAAAKAKPILTVGDSPDFLALGGAVQFVLVGDHVRFSVNLDACSRHRMNLSSELLKVAVTVTGNPGTGGAP